MVKAHQNENYYRLVSATYCKCLVFNANASRFHVNELEN